MNSWAWKWSWIPVLISLLLIYASWWLVRNSNERTSVLPKGPVLALYGAIFVPVWIFLVIGCGLQVAIGLLETLFLWASGFAVLMVRHLVVEPGVGHSTFVPAWDEECGLSGSFFEEEEENRVRVDETFPLIEVEADPEVIPFTPHHYARLEQEEMMNGPVFGMFDDKTSSQTQPSGLTYNEEPFPVDMNEAWKDGSS